jgi:outer membrane protein OmpA-like peptidoglycan-associated protein
VIDVIATSPHSIATRGDVVQRFHDAWFEALSLQSSRPETAAAHVGRWGYASWTGVNASNAGLDWHAQLRGIAQADAHQNARVFLDDALLQRRVTDARMAWRAAGVNIAEDGVIDGRFVTAYVARAEPSLLLAFPNPGFALDRAAMSPAADRRSSLLSSTQRLQDLIESGDSAHARALRSPSPEPMRVSSCDQVAFDPESEQLTPRMQTLLDQCVSALIASQAQVIVRVTGSSAWPGPFGRYNRAQIESVSRARAKLVADYLAAQGIDRRYIELRFMLPPLSRRETLDTSIQSRDRFVALDIFRQ